MFKLILGALIGYFIYPISLLTKRDKRKWCLGGTENSKYFFLLGDFKSINVKAIWISNDKAEVLKFRSLGYSAFEKLSIKGLYHMLTAKVYFITHGIGDVNRWTCGNVKIVSLWHGIPYKKIQFDDNKHKRQWYAQLLFPTSTKPFDLQVTSSPFVEEIFKRSFNVKNNNFVEAMFPRNMILMKSPEEVKRFLMMFGEDKLLSIVDIISVHSKSFIYMPTFRDSRRDFIKEADFDFDKMQSVLEKEDILFMIKLHPETNSNLIKKVVHYPNILIIPNDVDVYPLLPFTTGLITDYSSIYFDYILMNGKRVIFYTFDYKKYQSEDRDFNFDDSYMKGEYCYNFNQLMSTLINPFPPFVSQEDSRKTFWSENVDITPILKATQQLLS